MNLNDQIEFFQEEDSDMDYVETNCKTLHINPPIKLKANHFYIVKVTDKALTVFESVAHQSYQQETQVTQ